MSQNNYVAPSMELEHSDSASAKCSVGLAVMFGAGAVYWAGAVATYAAVVTHDVFLVT